MKVDYIQFVFTVDGDDSYNGLDPIGNLASTGPELRYDFGDDVAFISLNADSMDTISGMRTFDAAE